MERYSTLYGAHTIVNASGKEINEYIETSRSAGLDDFLRKRNIPNPTLAAQDVNATLTGFVKLPGYEAQPADCRPMLVRYAPMHLKRLDKYESNVISFNGIACSAPDHQVGNRDGKYRNTHYIDRNLLLNVGEYNFLDQIFGTHLVTWQENQNAKAFPIDHDAMPGKVQPARKEKDGILVQMAAAALCNKAAVILKLEEGCTFQLRSMELLKEIYALFAPIQAAEIGFSSYEDPARIPQIIADTAIRLFVVPAEVELGAVEKQPNMLVLDLNKQIEKPKANDLLRAVSVWYGTPWKDRVRIMGFLFADMIDPNDAQTYVERSRKYKEASTAMNQVLKERRSTVETMEALKALHESFGDLMDIPVLHERFCSAAPRLMKLPDEYKEKAKTPREMRHQMYQWITSKLVALGADAAMEKKADAAGSGGKEILYRFCTDVFKANVDLEVSREVGRRTRKLTTEAVTQQKDREFADERAAIKEERAGFANRLEKAVADEAVKWQIVVNTEQANTQRVQEELNQAHIDHQNALEEEKNQSKAKLEAAVAAGRAAVEAEKANTQRVQGELEQARIDHQNALEEEKSQSKAKLEAAEAAGRAAVEVEKANTQRVQGQLEQARIDHQNALEQEKNNSKAAADAAVKAERDKHQRTLNELEQSHEAEVRTLKTDNQNALSRKDSEIDNLKAELETKKAEVQKAVRGHVPMTRFCGLNIPTMAKSLVIFVALIGLVAGLVGGGLLGGFIGYRLGGPKETIVTLPTESKAPAVDTKPAETTKPVETTKATEPEKLLVDGEINWDYVYENMADIVKLEHEDAQMEAMLSEMHISTEGYAGELEAVLSFSGAKDGVFLTVQRTPAEQNQETDAPDATTAPDENPEEPTVETTAETEPEVRLLAEMVPAFVMDNGTYRFEVFYELKARQQHDAVAVAEELFRELTEDTAKVTITAKSADGETVDLHGLMSEVSENEMWWQKRFELDLDEDSRYIKQTALSTSKMPVLLICFEDGSEALLYDYADETDKRETMVGVLRNMGYNGAYNETMVIGLTAQETAAGASQNSDQSGTEQNGGNP